MAARRSVTSTSTHTTDGHGDLGDVGHGIPLVDGGQPTWEVSLARHREHRAPYAGDEGEQRAEGGGRSGHHDDHLEPRARRDGRRGVAQGGRARGERVDAERAQQHDARDGVERHDDGEGSEDRARDGACGVDDLLAEGRDAGVAGEGEEEDGRALQHSPDADRRR